jgi:DNA-binding beta-propeller fold protein YncE
MILDKNGNVVANLRSSAFLDGPWDLTVVDQGSQAIVFVSNVLSGTITRLDLSIPAVGDHVTVDSMTKIGSGYMHTGDPMAFEIGPTGLAYDAATDVLYVASTGDNAIFSISNAAERHSNARMGNLVYQDSAHLRGPLGLVLAPNGNLIAANGDSENGDPTQPSELVEFTKSGQFVGQIPVDTGGQGGAFGIAVEAEGDRVRFAAVDDISNSLKVWDFEFQQDE